MAVWRGSCHCGAVRYTVEADITELTRCDCSLCRRKNALMAQVPESALTITQGEADLTLYQWNMHIARHYFCRHCGIYTFHRKRSAPDHYGVNVFCLEGFDPSSVRVRAAEGANMTLAPDADNPDWSGPRL